MASTITITFGDQAENHVGMQKIGQLADNGFSIEELRRTKQIFEERGCSCEFVDLNRFLPTGVEGDPAAVLIVRGGLNKILSELGDNVTQRFWEEQQALSPDTKAKMYGRVVNKHARYNLCFGESAQEPDYDHGKGRIVAFSQVPLLNRLRQEFPRYLGDKATQLMAEGNYYYDVTKCGIGWHGDSERKRVIALRLGASLPLHYHCFSQGKAIGNRVELTIQNGDLYVMSEKATGWDWKKRKIATLRHAAEKFLSL